MNFIAPFVLLKHTTMKPILMFLLLVTFGFIFSCTKEPVPTERVASTITKPFEAKYTGVNKNIANSNLSTCDSEFQRILEVAYGKGDYVGFSTLYSDFCFNTKELKVGLSYIRTYKGDTLFISYYGKTCKGLGIPVSADNDHPDEICCWNIPFVILGGTGLFKHAGGSGVTDDYLSSVNHTYYHSWTGEITLSKDQYDKMK
jgi:hypothetical protein